MTPLILMLRFLCLVGTPPSCLLCFLMCPKGLTLYFSVLQLKLNLVLLFMCTVSINHRNKRLSFQILQVFSTSPEWINVVIWAAWRRINCPIRDIPLIAFYLGPLMVTITKMFPTRKSSNGLLNFWLLSETGFLSQLIEHKLQLTLEGLTCILGSF